MWGKNLNQFHEKKSIFGTKKIPKAGVFKEVVASNMMNAGPCSQPFMTQCGNL